MINILTKAFLIGILLFSLTKSNNSLSIYDLQIADNSIANYDDNFVPIERRSETSQRNRCLLFFLKNILFFFLLFNQINLDCVWKICGWAAKKTKNNHKRT